MEKPHRVAKILRNEYWFSRRLINYCLADKCHEFYGYRVIPAVCVKINISGKFNVWTRLSAAS